MKFLRVLTVALLFAGTVSQAQITKGNWMMGGSGNFVTSSYKSTTNTGSSIEGKSSGVNLSPTFGYFVADKLVLGISPGFSYSKTDGGNDQTSYGAGPFIRYYLLSTEKRLNILTHASYYYGTGNTDTTANSFNFKAGPAIFLNSSVALEFTLNYDINQIKFTSDKSTFRSFSVGVGFQIHLEKE